LIFIMSHHERDSPRDSIFSLRAITDTDQAGHAIDRPVALSRCRPAV